MADPKVAVSRLVESINAGTPTAHLDELYSEDAEFVRPGLRVIGRQAYAEYLKKLMAVFPDARLNIKHLIGEGEIVAAEWEFTGSAKGKSIVFDAMTITTVEDGKITSMHEYFDPAEARAQLGPSVPRDAAR